MDYTILTNNPKVNEKFGDSHRVSFYDVPAESILSIAADMIDSGCVLLNHPLYGSVKPNETPYKSLLLKKKAGTYTWDAVSSDESRELINKAITAYNKFTHKKEDTSHDLLLDYQVVDLSLLASAAEAVDE